MAFDVSRDASRTATPDASSLEASRLPRASRDASLDAGEPGRACAWCTGPIPASMRTDAECCSSVCRKRRWRFQRVVPRGSRRDASQPPARGTARFAYADPPYPGKAGYYVERTEVDHASLLDRLGTYVDGWALSTSAAALRDVLVLCPPDVRVCVWRRPVRPGRSARALSAWEPLIVRGGRPLDTSHLQTVLDHLDYRGRYHSFPGALVGMKPPEFAVWMFEQLGAMPGDTLDDLYPGSGAVTRAWSLYASSVDDGRVSRIPETASA